MFFLFIITLILIEWDLLVLSSLVFFQLLTPVWFIWAYFKGYIFSNGMIFKLRLVSKIFGHFDFVAKLKLFPLLIISNSVFSLSSLSTDFLESKIVCIKHSVYIPVEGSWFLEKFIIHIAAICWINTNEITSSVILCNSLSKQFFILRSSHSFQDILMLQVFWLFFNQHVNLIYQFLICRLGKIILVKIWNCLFPFVFQLIEWNDSVQVCVFLGNENVLKLLVQRSLLILIRPHPILCFVLALFLPIKLFYAD